MEQSEVEDPDDDKPIGANEPFTNDWGQSGFKLGGGRWPLGTPRFRLSLLPWFAFFFFLFFYSRWLYQFYATKRCFKQFKDAYLPKNCTILRGQCYEGIWALTFISFFSSKFFFFILNLQKLIIFVFFFFFFSKTIQDKQQKKKNFICAMYK